MAEEARLMSHSTIRNTANAVLVASALCLSAPASSALVVTKVSELGLLFAPVTLGIGTVFNDASATAAGIQIPGVGTLLSSDTFLDGYGFQVNGAGFGAITVTLDLGSHFQLSNLQLSLLGGTLGEPTLGTVVSSIDTPWSVTGLMAAGTINGNAQEITFFDLPAGGYVLEVRGNVTGTSGGSYAGTMSLSPLSPPEVLPVPEPAAFGLVSAGLVALLGFARRRRERSVKI